jgi:tetratricopeptide (TPR) repeat protein
MLTELGYIAINQEDYSNARKRLEEALSMAREVGDKRYIALAVLVLAGVIWHMGNPIEARKLYVESLTLYRELGDRLAEANTLRNLGHVAHRDGDAREAGRFYRQSLRIARDVGNKPNIALLLTALAGLVGSLDKPREAAQLLGAADALLESTGGRLPPTDRIQRRYTYETLRTVLGDARLDREIENGKAISMETSLQLVEADLLALAS